MLMILHRSAKPWQLTASCKVGAQFKKKRPHLYAFPWKLCSSRSLAGAPRQAAPLALLAVAIAQPGRPRFAWHVSPVSVATSCWKGEASCPTEVM